MKNRKTIDNTISLVSNSFFLTQSELKKNHEAFLPSIDVYNYWPQGNEVIIFNEKKPWKSIRKIYFDVQYNQYENNLLKQFKLVLKEYCKKVQIAFPEGWNDEDNLRYIYSTNCNIDKAINDMIVHFEWRRTTFPIKITNKVIDILNLGFLYILGKDYQFKPIIICQVSVFTKHQNKFSYEEWLSATLFLCQYMCTYILIPGHVENWIMITDVQNVHVFLLPQSIKKIIRIISDQFRSRLDLNFIIGLTPGMRFLYKLICKFLDECTVQKLIVVDQIQSCKLLKHISPDNLEEKYGGKIPNVKIGLDTLFPPMSLKNKQNNKDIVNVSQSNIQIKLNQHESKTQILKNKNVNCQVTNELNDEFQIKNNYTQYKSMSSLIEVIKEFNYRKKMLNKSFLDEANFNTYKASKQLFAVCEDNRNNTEYISMDNLSTNTYHK